MQEPRLSVADLRFAGCLPDLPCQLELADGGLLRIERVLRFLPGKRLVADGRYREQRVLAKVFFAPAWRRHVKREASGVQALSEAGLPTPRLLGSHELSGGAAVLLFEFVEGAVSLAECWRALRASPDDEAAWNLLTPVLLLLARMHRAGIWQADLHLGNFLQAGDHLLLVDGDAIHVAAAPLKARLASRNLALLVAQLPITWGRRLKRLVDLYCSQPGALPMDMVALEKDVVGERTKRLREYLAKTLRNCTDFLVDHTPRRFVAVLRPEAARLKPLLERPDAVMAAGQVLKDGATCTVVRVHLGGLDLVVKRYNLKSWRHALARSWRQSRAMHSWREAHRLRYFGLTTPRPLALVEERLGALRGRAYLITEYCAGPRLWESLRPESPPTEAEASAIRSVFRTLFELRIAHGDLKAANLLWQEGRVSLIDLDATVQYQNAASFRKAWARDRQRLLRNWPAGSLLCQWLDENLPEA
ncbi:lipopolysaccharide kinase InaA family protein [uncultured Azonexus sp.]|uniref:lipopolysaccharide kinase InaA family protein n=1 Tax=uncultured Azonexus sp. TaxID=520307 RepID=UPI00262DE4D6|nr:lipopolysaccharide kinase InaA family protein [uncultured Azonexus sp.]